jgi:hypothetical protein
MSDVGLCWLRSCKRPGEELVVGGYRIVLCHWHRALLEESSQGGYSTALPPPRGQGVKDPDGNEWWPWEPA